LASLVTLFDGLENGGYIQWLVLLTLFGGYPAAFIFGLPAYFSLRDRLRPRLVYALLLGGLVAAAPWALLTLVGPNPSFASIGDHVTVQNGQKTLWGWIEAFKLVGEVFLLGLVGGGAFWCVLTVRKPMGASKPAT
jgi:hypothetical protein